MNYSKMTSVDKDLPIQNRIAFLEYCDSVYETGESPISDSEYDQEKVEIESIDPSNTYFDNVGGAIASHVYGSKVTHDVIMGSLAKCLDVTIFEKWFQTNHGKHVKESFLLQHKVDGLSLSLLYKKGKLVRATTRGDGITGVDVTANAVHVQGVLQTIDCKDEVEVRGECFKERDDFYKIWHGMGFANPRNFCAGSILHKDSNETKKRKLNFVGYEAIRKEFDTEREKNNFLEEQGFDTLNSSTRFIKSGLSADKVAKAVKQYMDAIDRKKLQYDIDGVVCKLNDIELAQSMGSTSDGRKPKSNVAIKFPPEQVVTKLKEVVVEAGRTGQITPVGIFEPVQLGGAIIQRASLHNFANIRKLKIKIGCEVLLQKSGDIIPYVVKRVKDGDKPVTISKKCPSCKSDLEWDDDKISLWCRNGGCPAKLNKRIEYWFKKIGVKGIGKGIISKLTDPNILVWENEPIIASLPEMYYMLDNDRRSEHPFRKYAHLQDFFGEKAFSNIVEAVKSIEEIPLHIFVEALGIGNIGRMAKDICKLAPSVDKIDKLTVADIEALEGFGGTKAKGFVDGWKALRSEISTLLTYVKIKQKMQSSNKLAGKAFCFTGSFSKSRTQLQEMATDHGGNASSSVGKTTILVHDGEIQGSKYNKALKNKNEIISEKEFLSMLD